MYTLICNIRLRLTCVVRGVSTSQSYNTICVPRKIPPQAPGGRYNHYRRPLQLLQMTVTPVFFFQTRPRPMPKCQLKRFASSAEQHCRLSLILSMAYDGEQPTVQPHRGSCISTCCWCTGPRALSDVRSRGANPPHPPTGIDPEREHEKRHDDFGRRISFGNRIGKARTHSPRTYSR